MENRAVHEERRQSERDTPTKLDDLLYDAFFSARLVAPHQTWWGLPYFFPSGGDGIGDEHG